MIQFKDKSRVPNGGLVIYIDPDSGLRITHPYYEQVRVQAKKHRVVNNYPIGSDWDRQFEENVCQNQPEACQELGPDKRPTVLSMVGQFAREMGRWIKEGLPIVTPEVFDMRLSTCRACNYWGGTNGAYYLGRCGKCSCSGIALNLATKSCPDNPPRWKATV